MLRKCKVGVSPPKDTQIIRVVQVQPFISSRKQMKRMKRMKHSNKRGLWPLHYNYKIIIGLEVFIILILLMEALSSPSAGHIDWCNEP